MDKGDKAYFAIRTMEQRQKSWVTRHMYTWGTKDHDGEMNLSGVGNKRTKEKFPREYGHTYPRPP